MKVHYVLKRYPRLSETFIVREILNCELQGVSIAIDALMTPEDEPQHESLSLVKAPVRYLPRHPESQIKAGLLVRLGWRHPMKVLRLIRRTRLAVKAGDAKAWRRLWHILLVADRARREGATNLHAHFATGAAEVAVPAGDLVDIPVSITAHAKDIYHAENEGSLRARVRGASAIVTVSAYNLAHLEQVIGEVGPVLRHVPNGVALGPRNATGVGSARGPVLCVARLVDKKGLDTLLEAIAMASRADPLLRLEIIGGGPLSDQLQQLAIDLDIATIVTFHGPQPSSVVEAAYARCGLVALPCRIAANGDRDGLPTVLVEALARGIPVISTDVVGIPELVRHEITGLLVGPNDPPELAAAVAKIRSDSALARELGNEGRTLVARCFDPADAAIRLCEVWDEVRL